MSRPGELPELASIPWLAALGEADIARIEGRLNVRRLRANRSLCHQHDPAVEAYLLMSGRIRLLSWRTDDSFVVLDDPVRGSWIGASECLASTTYLVDARSIDECVVASVRAPALATLLQVEVVRDELFRQIVASAERLHELIELREPPRLILAMLEHLASAAADRSPERLTIAITQDELAARTGLSRETVNRHLRRLADEHALEIGRGSITLLRGETDDR